MPAPKQFKPGPQTIREVEPVSRAVVTKGRYSVVAPEAPIIDDPAVVEIAVDDLTIVIETETTSKYEERSLHAYGDVGIESDEETEDIDEIVPEPALPKGPVFGEWRSESTLEGTHYHRKDSRRI
ncbi:MAG: hypothetical protein U9N78_04565 [Actinomycetota bacterium]|nr:hypothetical protein [Actinomycetota bacterium]